MLTRRSNPLVYYTRGEHANHYTIDVDTTLESSCLLYARGARQPLHHRCWHDARNLLSIIREGSTPTITPSMLTRRSNPLVYYTRGEHANHYTIDVDTTLESSCLLYSRGARQPLHHRCWHDARILLSIILEGSTPTITPSMLTRRSNPLVYYTRGEHANHYTIDVDTTLGTSCLLYARGARQPLHHRCWHDARNLLSIIREGSTPTITPSMLTRRSEPLVYYTRGEHANHYTIDVDTTLGTSCLLYARGARQPLHHRCWHDARNLLSIIREGSTPTITPSMLTRRSEPLVYYTRGEHANHYTIDVDTTLESSCLLYARGARQPLHHRCWHDARNLLSIIREGSTPTITPSMLTRRSEPLVYYTRGEHANHYTIDVDTTLGTSCLLYTRGARQPLHHRCWHDARNLLSIIREGSTPTITPSMLTRRSEPLVYYTRGEHANHYTIDVDTTLGTSCLLYSRIARQPLHHRCWHDARNLLSIILEGSTPTITPSMLTRRSEPLVYYTRGEHANHYTIDVDTTLGTSCLLYSRGARQPLHHRCDYFRF